MTKKRTKEKVKLTTFNITRTFSGSITLYVPENMRQMFRDGYEPFWENMYMKLGDKIDFDELSMDCEVSGDITDPTETEEEYLKEFVLEEDRETLTSLGDYIDKSDNQIVIVHELVGLVE